MPDVTKISREPQINFFRERKLLAENKGAAPLPAEQDLNAQAVTVATNLQKVTDKARRILEEASRLAIVRRVPVPADALEVRGAVQRRDPTSEGAFITYELYRESLHYLRKKSRALPVQILDELTGDPLTDHRRLSAKIRETVDGVSREQAELLGSQILILVVLKLLQLGLDNLDTGAQTSTKQPPTVELPIIAANLALSIAAQQLYAGLNQKEIEDSLKELGPIPPLDMARAKQKLAESPLFQSALDARKPSDHEIVVRFVDAFLNRQTVPGWETWQAAGPLGEVADWCEESANSLQRYRKPVATDDRRAETLLDDQTINDVVGTLVTSSIQVQQGRVATPNRIDDTTLAIYQRQLGALNRAVDKIGHVLGHTVDLTDLCCFLRWLEVQDRDTVKNLRTLLLTVQGVFETLDNAGASSRFSAQLSVSTAIHQATMLLLQDLKAGIMAKMRKWLQTSPERWKELFRCRLIDELIEYVVRCLEELEARLVALLDRYLGYVEDQEKRLDVNVDTMGNQKEIRALLAIMDQFLDFTGPVSEACPDEPDPAQLASSAARVLEGLGPSVPIPIGGDPFATVASEPVELSTGIRMPAIPGRTAGVTLEEAAREVCQGGLVDQNLVPFPRE